MELHALDGLAQIAKINQYQRVEVIERDLDTGAWLLEIPADDGQSAASQLAAATWPGIEIYDPDTGWRFGGYVTSIAETRTANRTTVTFRGNDFQTELQNRLEWPSSAEIAFWWTTVYGGTLPLTTDAHNAVFFQCAGGALPYRQIPGIEMGVDPSAGAPKGRRIKGIPMLEVLREMFTAEAWTARLRLVREAQAATTTAVVRFDTPARQQADIVLDARRGTAEVTVTDEADTATMVIGMGAEFGGGPGRYVSAAHDPFFADSWRNRYVETFINRPGTDTQAQMIADVTNQLAELRLDRKVVVDGAEVDGFGRTVDIGWMVPVTVGSSFGATRVDLPVVASKLTFNPKDGWRRTVDIGAETLAGPAKVYSDVGRVAKKVRQIETELNY